MSAKSPAEERITILVERVRDGKKVVAGMTLDQKVVFGVTSEAMLLQSTVENLRRQLDKRNG